MTPIRWLISFFTRWRRGPVREPVGALRIVDPSPLNWLWVLYNTAEELVRVTPRGKLRPAAASRYRWVDDRTVEAEVREDERFPDGEPMTAATVKRSFDEATRWVNPHPPGTFFVIDPRTRCEVTGERTVRFHLPEVDGLALGKLRRVRRHEHSFLGRAGLRLRPHRHRRGPLVND